MVGHPNIVEVLQHGWLPSPFSDYYFFDMEYCEKTLEDHINITVLWADEAVSDADIQLVVQKRVEAAFQISRDIINGLAFIHENGEVHRDLKPRNGIS